MTTIIRRYRRRRSLPLSIALVAAIAVLALAAWLFLVIWARGGPQPVHQIVIELPAPQAAPTAARRA